MEKIALPVSFEDERGKIIDILSHEAVDAVTLITFAKDAVRANHFHKETTQWNYVLSGKIKLACQFPDKEVEESIMTAGDFIVTHPHESHALQALEDSVLLVLTRGPRGGKEYESDTFRLETPLL